MPEEDNFEEIDYEFIIIEKPIEIEIPIDY
jgi:hypothetical protein